MDSRIFLSSSVRSLVSFADLFMLATILTMKANMINKTIPAIPYLASGDSLSMSAILKHPIEQRILDAMAEHEFFILQPGDNDKRVYQSATKHILEFIGSPAHQITLAVRVVQNDLGTVADLMRLVPVFCEAIDSSWNDASQWLQKGLDLYETKQENLEAERHTAKVEFQPMPELGYVMVAANINIKPQATEK